MRTCGKIPIWMERNLVNRQITEQQTRRGAMTFTVISFLSVLELQNQLP